MPTDVSAVPATSTAVRRIPWVETWGVILSLSAVTATLGAVCGYGRDGGFFLPAVGLGVMVVAAAFDAATNRIPNSLTYTAVIVGVSVNCADLLLRHFAPQVALHWLGAVGATQAVMGLLVFGGIGLVGVLFAGMGGGDMKLLAAVGAVLGLVRASDGLLCGAVVAVIYSLVNLLIAGRMNATLQFAAARILNVIYLRQWQPLDDAPQTGSRRTIPLAIPLMAGMILVRVPVIAERVSWLTHPG